MTDVDTAQDMLGHAVRLATRHAFYVFPVDHPSLPRCRGLKSKRHNPDTCNERGKHPACKWSEAGTTDVERLAMSHYFGGKEPRNIGVDCGKSGIAVIDEDEADELAKLAVYLGIEFPDTYTVETHDGRQHYYYDQPAGREPLRNATRVHDFAVDIRGVGGLVVGAGSLHQAGAVYTVVRDVPRVELPGDVAYALTRTPASTGGGHDAKDSAKWWADGNIPGGKHHDALVSAAGYCRRRGLERDMAVPTIRDVFNRLTDNTGDPYTWDEALAELDEIYDRYPAGYRFDEKFNPKLEDAPHRNGDKQAPPPPPPPRTRRKDRATWDVTNTAIAADQLQDTIGRGLLAGMFNRTGDVVHTPREGDDGYIPPRNEEWNDGPAQVRAVSASELASRISYTYDCYKVDKDGDRHPALFPVPAARVAVDVPDMLPHLRHLRGVTHTPIVRRDGTILATPGYDPGSQLLYLPDPQLIVPPIPERPTRNEAEQAAATLTALLVDFRFVTDHDRANYIGLWLTPLLRELRPPPYKQGAITAPQPGSGKSLLASIMRITHGGVFRSEVPSEEGELRKQITSILDVTTGPVVQFDNVTGVLRSSTLAGLLTSGRWDDRRLGVNDMVSRPNDRLWIITGNNVAIGGDLPRRTVCVTIDPGVPDPHLRTNFAIPNLEQFTNQHRGGLLAAMLTMIRAWITDGADTTPRAGDGYARWVEAVDGILSFAGIAGTFDHADTTRETIGVDDSEWRDLLVAAWRAFGREPFTCKELLAKVDTTDDGLPALTKPIPVDALPGDLMDKALKTGPRSCSRSLGRWFSNRDGRWAGGFTVRSAGADRDKAIRWQIVKAERQ